MFTGLIEEVGTVLSVKRNSLEIACKEIQDDLSIGDSVAVNGVCLTVTAFSTRFFKVEVMPITLEATNLGLLKPGSSVNLERAMMLGSRLGGHLVAGHIDSTAAILGKEDIGEALLVSIGIPKGYEPLIIRKGSVAIDGISLTVAEIHKKSFTVSLVGHSRRSTTLARRNVGDLVNIECDQMGKYVQNIILKTNGNDSTSQEERTHGVLSFGYLMEQGFTT